MHFCRDSLYTMMIAEDLLSNSMKCDDDFGDAQAGTPAAHRLDRNFQAIRRYWRGPGIFFFWSALTSFEGSAQGCRWKPR